MPKILDELKSTYGKAEVDFAKSRKRPKGTKGIKGQSSRSKGASKVKY